MWDGSLADQKIVKATCSRWIRQAVEDRSSIAKHGHHAIVESDTDEELPLIDPAVTGHSASQSRKIDAARRSDRRRSCSARRSHLDGMPPAEDVGFGARLARERSIVAKGAGRAARVRIDLGRAEREGPGVEAEEAAVDLLGRCAGE